MIRWIKKKLGKIKVVEDHNDQKPVGEREVNGFEFQIRLEHELAMRDIRSLKHELAMKDAEMRHLKRQLDLREKEFASLRIAIHSACTNLGSAVTTAALKFKDKRPSKKGIEHVFTEEDLNGAAQSEPGPESETESIFAR